jgi:hypothetical protein
MLDAPQHDWRFYEDLTRQTDAAWIRGLSASERFTIYADLFNMIWQARQTARFSDRLEERRWQQKLEIRESAVNAFAKLDQFRSERTASEHPG